ncbi:putative lipoprotein [Pectobacterium atrosepticum SCRI1043]|uniref:Lipoprotein n=1 Tax=Pectobacterium atrosepticum (strain SCRI 1043 / ATCC BAA-672) TaxID=218491 RepID=Q6DAD8_PECAS|nr:putative lipoprotein [Pectobacterium atrosepticum SCRI1043]
MKMYSSWVLVAVVSCSVKTRISALASLQTLRSKCRCMFSLVLAHNSRTPASAGVIFFYRMKTCKAPHSLSSFNRKHRSI